MALCLNRDETLGELNAPIAGVQCGNHKSRAGLACGWLLHLAPAKR